MFSILSSWKAGLEPIKQEHCNPELLIRSVTVENGQEAVTTELQ